MQKPHRTTEQLLEELQAAQARIAALEREHLSLADDIPDALITTDLQGHLTWLNRGARLLLGYSEQEALAMRLEQLLPEDLRAGHVRRLQRLRQTGQTRYVDTECLTADGQRICVEMSLSLRTDSQDRPTSIVALLRDLTPRELATEALRRSEAKLAEAQRLAHIGSWELDLVRNELSWSDEIFRIFEVDKARFGASYEAFLDAIHPEDRALVNDAYTQSLQTKTPYTIVHRLLLGDGRVKFVHERCETHYDADGKPLRSVGTVQDITERHTLEERVRMAQKMEAIGRLAGGVAHDFNNVLCIVKGNTSMALLDLSTADPLRQPMEEIATAADRAADLTQQLLTFSRKQVIRPRVIDLSDLIEQLHPMLARVIGEDIILRCHTQKQLGRIRADPGQMEQIVLNLALNARDAMPEGGELLIETADVSLDDVQRTSHPDADPGAYIVLTVSDTGCGMSPGVQERIFEPFFTTKQLGKGTGLGLATVFAIVEQNDGWIDVLSEPGQGTAFKVHLPSVQDRAEALTSSQELSYPRGNETVLLVEDDDVVRNVAQQLLARFGYQVLSARSGHDALSLAESHAGPIHLLMTDMVMPLMDGRTLATKLTALRPETRVLFTSGYTEHAIVTQGMLEKQAPFIAKPYTAQELAARVREALASSTGIDTPRCRSTY